MTISPAKQDKPAAIIRRFSSDTPKKILNKSKPKAGKINSLPTLGFGVPATIDPHHFIVHIPKNTGGVIKISENLGLQANSLTLGIIDRVILERSKWIAIRGEVQRMFNTRLKEHQLKTSHWKIGDNLVDRLLGKELCVLTWAIKGIKPDNIKIAVRNWLALRPEERWWLFGMAVTNTGNALDEDKGWRLALRYALGELIQPDAPKRHKEKTSLSDPYHQLSIFND